MAKKKTIAEKIDTFLQTLLASDEIEVEKVEEIVEAPAEEVKLAQATLEDGTVIEYATLAVNEPIFIVMPEGNQPLPDGTYLIEAQNVTVTAGIITEIVPAEEVAPVETEETVENTGTPKEITEEVKRTVKMELEKQFKEEVKSITKKYEELLKLAAENKNSGVKQAPVENAPKRELTTKEYIMQMIEEKKKNN